MLFRTIHITRREVSMYPTPVKEEKAVVRTVSKPTFLIRLLAELNVVKGLNVSYALLWDITNKLAKKIRFSAEVAVEDLREAVRHIFFEASFVERKLVAVVSSLDEESLFKILVW